ncbi:ABC transporter permease [Phormidium tenue FACHB-886]|nr:ABC transporter permease [Phormidium tenue FACHB-886]
MVSLARKNLFDDIPRFLIAQAGIIFAVSLVSIQLGILKGFTRSTTLLIDRSNVDIWVASKDLNNFELTLPIFYQRLSQAQKVQGVARAEAMILKTVIWRKPSGEITTAEVIGVEPNSQLISPGTLTQGSLNRLQQPYSVIIDKAALEDLGVSQVGDQAQVGSLAAKLVGVTQGIQSNASSSYVLTSLESAKAYSRSIPTKALSRPNTPALKPLTTADSITYVLIKAKPGEDLQALKQRLKAALPNTVAFTRSELSAQTSLYWEKLTSIGFILGLGATVGVIVGMVIVGQILYASVSEHLREFGTIRAMGAPNWVAYAIVLEQALWMAILGYLPGMALCLGLGAWTVATQGVLILITPLMGAEIFAVTVLMCVGSTLFAMHKVTRVDPAVVFKT